jgi:hypothetical protein
MKVKGVPAPLNPGANVIKLYMSVIYNFRTKVECLLDEAWKSSRVQTLAYDDNY